MRKFTRLTAMILATTLASTSVFALTPEQLKVRDAKHQQMVTTVTDKLQAKPEHVEDVLFTDELGNILTANASGWDGIYHMFTWHKKPSSKEVTIKKPGYKTVVTTVKTDVPQTVKLVPEKITQTTIGKVSLPDGFKVENMWIAVVDTNKPVYANKIAYMKVNQDGTFKMHNLPKGNYKVEVIIGEHADYYKDNGVTCTFDNSYAYQAGNLTVDGNVDKTFDLSKEAITGANPKEFYNTLDYSNTDAFLKITPFIELPEDAKKIADTKFNDKKDLSTVKQIFKYIVNTYGNKPSGSPKPQRDLTVPQLLDRGYLDSCGEFGAVFMAFARYKGIPCTYVATSSTEWIKDIQKTNTGFTAGHVFSEVYVDGKWILINTTNGDIYTDYDKDNFHITSTSSNYKNDTMYVISKSINPKEEHMSFNEFISLQRDYAKNFDLTLLDTLSPIKKNGTVN